MSKECMRGFWKLEDAEAFRKTINGDWDIVTLVDGSLLFNGQVIGYFLKEVVKPSTKTLTDFEIKGVLGLDECWVGEDSSMPNMIAFARAILKKAQEK